MRSGPEDGRACEEDMVTVFQNWNNIFGRFLALQFFNYDPWFKCPTGKVKERKKRKKKQKKVKTHRLCTVGVG